MRGAFLGMSLAVLALFGGTAARAQSDTQQQLPQLDRGEKIEKLGFPAVLEK